MVIDTADLRSELPPVRDQLHRSTCLAFAVTTAHERARHANEAFSEEALYWRAKQADGNWDGGTTFDSANVALTQQGQPFATVWPYDPAIQDGQPYSPPPGCNPDCSWMTGTLQVVSPTQEAVCAELSAGRLVALGLLLTDAFEDAPNGDISTPPANAPTLGGHAVAAVGFDRNNRTVIIRNSWGDGWGAKGHANLPFDYFSKYVLDARVLAHTSNTTFTVQRSQR